MTTHDPFAFILACAAALGGSALHAGTTWHVDDDAPNDPGPGDLEISDPKKDGSPAHPFDSIQEALRVAQNGDQVVVAPGVYRELVNFNGEAIRLRSQDPGDLAIVAATIIDGGGQGPVVTCGSGEGPDTALIGFTITNGQAQNGGAMYVVNSSPTVTACLMLKNIATLSGGAVYLNSSSSRFDQCRFMDNEAGVSGGAMSIASGAPTIVASEFSQNFAQSFGGAIFSASADATILESLFEDNGAMDGGACYGFASSTRATSCEFRGNAAQSGGAVYVDQGAAAIANTAFHGNVATARGGALRATSSVVQLANVSAAANVAADEGGGAAIEGGAIAMSNSVLWANEDAGGDGAAAQLRLSGAAASIAHSCLPGAAPGPGNVSSDPRFVDADAGDLRLEAGSPCIDAGHNWLVVADAGDLDADGDVDELTPIDLDGQPRFAAGAAGPATGCGGPAVVDMGAFEAAGAAMPISLHRGDLDGSGAIDVTDVLDVLAAWGCEAPCCGTDVDASGDVGVGDLLLMLGAW